MTVDHSSAHPRFRPHAAVCDDGEYKKMSVIVKNDIYVTRKFLKYDDILFTFSAPIRAL